MDKVNSISSENPFFLTGVGFAGLIHNLKGHPPQWMPGMILDVGYTKREVDPLRLKAIAQQADNVRNQALWAVEGISDVVAIAADTGELTNRQMQVIAYATSFLTEIALVAGYHENTAAFMQTEQGKTLFADPINDNCS